MKVIFIKGGGAAACTPLVYVLEEKRRKKNLERSGLNREIERGGSLALDSDG